VGLGAAAAAAVAAAALVLASLFISKVVYFVTASLFTAG